MQVLQIIQSLLITFASGLQMYICSHSYFFHSRFSFLFSSLLCPFIVSWLHLTLNFLAFPAQHLANWDPSTDKSLVCSNCIDNCLNRVIFVHEKDRSNSQNLKVEQYLTSHPFFPLPFICVKKEVWVKYIFRLHSGNFLCSLPQHHRISVKCSSVKMVCSLPLAVLSHFAPKEGITEEEKLETLQRKLIVIFGIFSSQEAGLNKPSICRGYPQRLKGCKTNLPLNWRNLNGDLESIRVWAHFYLYKQTQECFTHVRKRPGERSRPFASSKSS